MRCRKSHPERPAAPGWRETPATRILPVASLTIFPRLIAGVSRSVVATGKPLGILPRRELRGGRIRRRTDRQVLVARRAAPAA